jgi:hypothetical protein
MSMQKRLKRFLGAAIAVALLGMALAAAASTVDDELIAVRRVFPAIGPGLRAIRHGADGKYYLLASPNVGIAIFDTQGKQLSVIGAPPPASVANKAGRSAIAFGEDCDVDAQGKIYVADRGLNLVTVFSPEGNLLRSMPADGPISVASLPEGEVAITTLRGSHLVTVFGPDGRLAREFGQPEELSTRGDLNRYMSSGRISSDPKGSIYYGYTYLPEPLVRQFDRFGYAGTDFEFTGLDAYPEAQAARKEITRQEKRADPPSFLPVITAFGVDPVNGDLWMALHNTLLHFDKEGVRQSEYLIYTKSGARLEATVLLVEENRLLIGSDPLGVYEFQRPDRKH